MPVPAAYRPVLFGVPGREETFADAFGRLTWKYAVDVRPVDMTGPFAQLRFADQVEAVRGLIREYGWSDRALHLKNLKKVKRRGYPLERMLMVDDRPEGLARQYGNLVPVPPFTGDPGDTTWQGLARYLPRLKDVVEKIAQPGPWDAARGGIDEGTLEVERDHRRERLGVVRRHGHDRVCLYQPIYDTSACSFVSR